MGFQVAVEAVQNSLEASAGEVWKYVAVVAIPALTAALVFVSKKLLDERQSRLMDREAIIKKLEDAREAKNRRDSS